MLKKTYLAGVCGLYGLIQIHANAESLLDVYQLVTAKDPQLQQSIAERNQAFEKINETDAAKLPQIDLSASANALKSNQNDLYSNHSIGTGLSLTQALFRQSLWTNSDITTKQAMASDVAMNQEKQSLILRTTQAYFSILAAQDSLQFAQANEQALKRQQDETLQRFKIGLVSITDTQQAKAAYDLAVAETLIAENTLANRFENLRQLTGAEYKFLDVLNLKRFSASQPTQTVEQWLKIATEKNLSLNQSRILKDVARQQIDLAKEGHRPTLDLKLGTSSTDNHYTVNNAAKVDGSLNENTIGLQFNLPLYRGGATDSQVKQAQYQYVAASQSQEMVYRQIQADIYRNYNDVFAGAGTIRAYQQSVVSAESALAATQTGYEVGNNTITDVLNATTNVLSAQQKLSTARYNYILSTLQLKLSAGTLSEQDLLDINQGLQKTS